MLSVKVHPVIENTDANERTVLGGKWLINSLKKKRIYENDITTNIRASTCSEGVTSYENILQTISNTVFHSLVPVRA